jgi:hypothetical protein
MNHYSTKRHPAGYASLLLVVTTCTLLLALMVSAYRRAMTAHATQSKVQIRTDYSEKEQAILRSIIAITPNRAIKAMQAPDPLYPAASLTWNGIFTDAITLANAGRAIAPATVVAMGNPRIANTGDELLGAPISIFSEINAPNPPINLVTAGINQAPLAGYPPSLSCIDANTTTSDLLRPTLSNNKTYGALAQPALDLIGNNLNPAFALPFANQPRLGRLRYPNINFGYAQPGSAFVAKQNWWAFSMNLSRSTGTNLVPTSTRNYVLSIYEVPSQLAISASSFMNLGRYNNPGNEVWDPARVSIAGGLFVGNANLAAGTAVTALASRRAVTGTAAATIGNQANIADPFAVGLRETAQLANGAFFPVSLASESGRAAFVPINRGLDFFDRFATNSNPVDEIGAVSPTLWSNYSIGAKQCAMRLDVLEVTSFPNNLTPTRVRFSYFQGGINQPRQVRVYNLDPATLALPNFPFSAETIGGNNQLCIGIKPRLLPAFLLGLGADPTNINSSIAVNVDYSAANPTILARKPIQPIEQPVNNYTEIGIAMIQCDNLSGFTAGFSLVTNLRLYIGGDFNTTPAAALAIPTNYALVDLQTFFPPCSIFAPQKRYGTDVAAPSVNVTGQIGSLASDTTAAAVNPLDTRDSNGNSLGSANITVNLRPITHPGALPPITMMNWLVTLEEVGR